MHSGSIKSWSIFDIEEKEKRINLLEKESAEDTLWQDRDRAQRILRELSGLRGIVSRIKTVDAEITDLMELLEIAETEDEADSISEIDSEVSPLADEIEKMELEIMLDGDDDDRRARLLRPDQVDQHLHVRGRHVQRLPGLDAGVGRRYAAAQTRV